MHEDLERLAEVDRLDREIARRQRAIERAEASLAEGQGAVAEREQAKAALAASLADNRTQQLAVQRTIGGHEANRDRARKALEMGHGDAAAAERQIERTSELIDTAETEQLELLEAQDGLDTELAAAEQALSEAQEALAVLLEEVPAAKAEHEAALATLGTQRTEVFEQLPAELARRYADFRARDKWAVAQIVDGACGSCRVDVPAQQQHDLSRGLIVPCRRCYRWVVLPP